MNEMINTELAQKVAECVRNLNDATYEAWDAGLIVTLNTSKVYDNDHNDGWPQIWIRVSQLLTKEKRDE